MAVVGGGPAGISACLELAKSSNLNVALFESEPELGGIPRSCHVYFGMRDLKRIYRGPVYSRKLSRLIRETSVQIHTQATVLKIIAGSPGKTHRIDVTSQEGLKSYGTRFVLLATGCFESSRPSRFIPGTRPAGIFTTGALQQLVNLRHQKPGRRALILGSEPVAFSSVLTLRRAGLSIAGMVEEDPRLQTYPSLAGAMSMLYGFPVYKGTSVKTILGDRRVEALELVRQEDQKASQVECDTLVITGKFRPDSALIDNTPIERDPLTSGPNVDQELMTSVPNIFAAGNVLRGADMHDLCALEGKKAAQGILKRLRSSDLQIQEAIQLRTEPPIRYVVPQRIVPDRTKTHLFSWLYPGFSMQVEHTLPRAVLEAWSGDERIWNGSFSRLIARKRYALPVEKFDWDRVIPENGVTLRLRESNP